MHKPSLQDDIKLEYDAEPVKVHNFAVSSGNWQFTHLKKIHKNSN